MTNSKTSAVRRFILRTLFVLCFSKCCYGTRSEQEQQQLRNLQKVMNDNRIKFQKHIGSEINTLIADSEEDGLGGFHLGFKLQREVAIKNESSQQNLRSNIGETSTRQDVTEPSSTPYFRKVSSPFMNVPHDEDIGSGKRISDLEDGFEQDVNPFDLSVIFSPDDQQNKLQQPFNYDDTESSGTPFDQFLDYDQDQYGYEDPQYSMNVDDDFSGYWNETEYTATDGELLSNASFWSGIDDWLGNKSTLQKKSALTRSEFERYIKKGFYQNFKNPSYNSKNRSDWHKRHDKKIRYKNPSHTIWHSTSNDVTVGNGKRREKFGGDQATLYTQWSKWSRCSRHCQQSRRRRCRVPSICGTALIKERRPCVGWRCQHEKFHLIKPNEISHRYGNAEKGKTKPRADVRVLLNYNSMFYTRWSEWASCSRTCLTSRYRSCRYSLFCGSAVIREEAYCYTQNSACEKWYRRHKLNSKTSKIVDVIDKNANKVTGNYHIGQHKVNHSQTLKTPSIPDEQIVFGHNKYVTESGFVPPDQNPEILQFQIGGKQHRFSPSNQNTIASNNDVTNERDYKVKQDHWFDKNNYKKVFGHQGNQQTANGQSTGKNSYYYKQPSYTDLQKPGKHTHRFDNAKSTSKSPFHHYSVGRTNSLPKKCGTSIFQKPPWKLRIIGGRESLPDKWPWQVAILNRFKEVFCGGTLIASQWIVTAAHCLRKRLYVRLAEHDLAIDEGQELEFKITETVPHPLYDSTTVDNDVALLRLPEPVESGAKISPACVPEQGATLPVGKECTIIGWGKKRNMHFFGTDVLNEAEVPIISDESCRKVYSEYYITLNMFCAGYRRGRIDSCAGDSGGPLLCHQNGLWYIYGITSFGEGCGTKGKYGIYANVANYRTWINDVIAAHAHRGKGSRKGKSPEGNHRRHEKHFRRHAKHGTWYHQHPKNHNRRNKPSSLTNRQRINRAHRGQ